VGREHRCLGRVATLTLTARDSSGLSVVQTYRFGGEDYRIGYSVAIAGLNPALDLRRYRIALRSWPLVTERTHGEDLANLGVTTKVGKDNRRHLASELKKGPKTNEGAIRWLAVHSKYFLLGLVPAEDVQGIASRTALAPGTLPEAHDQVEGSITIPLPAPGARTSSCSTPAARLLASSAWAWISSRRARSRSISSPFSSARSRGQLLPLAHPQLGRRDHPARTPRSSRDASVAGARHEVDARDAEDPALVVFLLPRSTKDPRGDERCDDALCRTTRSVRCPAAQDDHPDAAFRALSRARLFDWPPGRLRGLDPDPSAPDLLFTIGPKPIASRRS
jgi:hypothetical protein